MIEKKKSFSSNYLNTFENYLRLIPKIPRKKKIFCYKKKYF